MYGPTGVGFLWGKSEILEKMPPWKGGGEMIKEVHMAAGQQPQQPQSLGTTERLGDKREDLGDSSLAKM